MNPVQHAVETSKAGGPLAGDISYIMDNCRSECNDLDLAVINSNMPSQFPSLDPRIIAMTYPNASLENL